MEFRLSWYCDSKTKTVKGASLLLWSHNESKAAKGGDLRERARERNTPYYWATVRLGVIGLKGGGKRRRRNC